jgi:PAS domain-containing protein
MRLHFHSRVEFIGTLMEGILAVSADGRIVGANRGALEQLGSPARRCACTRWPLCSAPRRARWSTASATPLATPMPCT